MHEDSNRQDMGLFEVLRDVAGQMSDSVLESTISAMENAARGTRNKFDDFAVSALRLWQQQRKEPKV